MDKYSVRTDLASEAIKDFQIPEEETNINGIEFLIKITKIDSKKQKELSDTLGYSRILPSAWNTPTTM